MRLPRGVIFVCLLSISFVVAFGSAFPDNLDVQDVDPFLELSKFPIRAYSRPSNGLLIREFYNRMHAQGSPQDMLVPRGIENKRLLTTAQVDSKMSMLDRMLDRWRQRTIELGDCHKLPDFYREQERKSIENGYPAAKSLLQDVHREKEELIKVAAALKANGQEVDASRFKRKVEEWCRAYENCMKLVEDIMQEIKTSQTPKTSSSATPGVGRLRHFGHPRPPKYDDTYLGGGWKHVPKRQ